VADLGDVANLPVRLLAHELTLSGQVVPCAGDPRNRGLAAELAFGADLAGNAGHLRAKALS